MFGDVGGAAASAGICANLRCAASASVNTPTQGYSLESGNLAGNFMMTDPIADMLTRIRNAQKSRKSEVLISFSKLKLRIAELLRDAGYIGAVEERPGMPAMLRMELLYQGKEPVIHDVKRESKPGHRLYRKAGDMPRVMNDYGIAIVSTSRGLMTNKEARKLGVGGEVICSIY